MQILIDKLRELNNMLIALFAPVVAMAFLAVTDTELSAGAISSILVMALTALLSYGIEGAIAKWRKGLNPNVLQPIWQSKRFWGALAGAFIVMLNDAYPVGYETIIDGQSISFYEAITGFIVMAITGMSFDDWSEAGGFRIMPTVESSNVSVKLSHAQPAAPPNPNIGNR